MSCNQTCKEESTIRGKKKKKAACNPFFYHSYSSFKRLFTGHFFLATLHRLQNNYWLDFTEAVGSCREQSITHTEQTDISGEYNYETFKPPLSAAASQ